MTKENKDFNNKMGLVVGTTPARYKINNIRLMKPLCHQEYKDGNLTGSMLIQNLDSVNLNRNKKITYFVPNNIALLLSISNKALETAKQSYIKNFLNSPIELDLNKITSNKRIAMDDVSTLVCDYLETIQTAVVFGFTALETFANLSIPNNYTYSIENNNKGISEIYDKNAIERWLPLKTKINTILPQIYQTKKIEHENWWGNFLNLENYRNDIIHQKSISHTEFYKVYFKESIFTICQTPNLIIQFFYDAHADENKTNPIWPWTNKTSALPINREYNSDNFEVIGNLYEGVKKNI